MKEAYIFAEMREKTGKFIANYTLTADTGGSLNKNMHIGNTPVKNSC
jgi:hypothetical protein